TLPGVRAPQCRPPALRRRRAARIQVAWARQGLPHRRRHRLRRAVDLRTRRADGVDGQLRPAQHRRHLAALRPRRRHGHDRHRLRPQAAGLIGRRGCRSPTRSPTRQRWSAETTAQRRGLSRNKGGGPRPLRVHSGVGTAPLSRGGLQVLTNLTTPPIIAARSAAAGIVSSHTPNIGRKQRARAWPLRPAYWVPRIAEPRTKVSDTGTRMISAAMYMRIEAAPSATADLSGSSLTIRTDRVRTTRQPLSPVPRARAAAMRMRTGQDTSTTDRPSCGVASTARMPTMTSAAIFWASWTPWTRDREAVSTESTILAPLNSGFGGAEARSFDSRAVSAQDRMNPRIGDSSRGHTTEFIASSVLTENPNTMPAPSRPPMRQCVDDTGKARRYVNRLHTVAAAKAMSRLVRITSALPVKMTIWLATTNAMPSPSSAPMKLKTTARLSAHPGLSARPTTALPIVSAASWNPFEPAKITAATMTPTNRSSTDYDSLIAMAATTLPSSVKPWAARTNAC